VRRHRRRITPDLLRPGGHPVTIENPDWLAFIDRYDRSGALFYLDPPYWGCEDDYGKLIFGRDQFAAIADRLGRLKGSFILSINDLPEIREIFRRFAIIEVSLNYTVSTGKDVAASELIVRGRV
jgi:DNA adenine methylase